MSSETYNVKWSETQSSLIATLQLEPVQIDRRQFRTLLSSLYQRYIKIANQFSECVDQIIQPQKRQLTRRLLESVLGRIVELKGDLIEADLCEWTYCADVLSDDNGTNRIFGGILEQLRIPKCFGRERDEEITEREQFIDQVLEKFGYLDNETVKERATHMSEHQAILIIQVHERARQGRLRAQFMREVHTMKSKAKPQAGLQSAASQSLDTESLSLTSAVSIQRMWRGYVARRNTRHHKHKEMLLIGMIPKRSIEFALVASPPKSTQQFVDIDIEMDSLNRKRRRQLQEQRAAQLLDETERCKTYLERKCRGPMLEQLSDEVRNWLQEYRTQTGKVPEYAGSERTTSRALMSRQGTESETSKSTPVSSKDSKGKKEKTSKKDKSDNESEEGADEGSTKATISVFVPELNALKEEFEEIWKSRDESTNTEQIPYSDIIEHEQLVEMEDSLKKVVDEMMKGELELLQDAMNRDRGFKGKKKSGKKVRKGGKKTKKKKEKDLTPDRTTESLFEELVANGIIKKYPKVYLEEFKGEISYHKPQPHNVPNEQAPSLGDSRQTLATTCILPLSVPHVRNSIHAQLRSILLAGPVGSGKRMLVNAMCTESGATLFDLTPTNIVGKYPGKSGLAMLVHLVVKVARLLQPSVIFMEMAERPFVRKVSKADKNDPKRLRKDLPKIVKYFAPEDRVLIVGTSTCPWEGDQKLLQQVYQKFILIPRPDYVSRYAVWQYMLLERYTAIDWDFDISVLSKISDGYTVGSIVGAIREVMTVKRVLQLRVKPLSPLELVNALCKWTPVYKEEEQAGVLWWQKTPMFRRRCRAVELLEEDEAERQSKQAKNKK